MVRIFYKLGATFAKKWFWGQVDLNPEDEIYQNGMRGFKGAVRIEIDSGYNPGDFLWNSHGLILVSQKVLDLWQKFAKFDTYGVVIKGSVSPIEYTGVIVPGRGGPFDEKRSKAEYKILEEGGEPSLMGIDGLYFDEDKWDGSDLFTLPEFPRYCLATERLVGAMKKAKITNCKYKSVEKVRF